ncbi:hypothetical protein T492DRAFT_844271 [Pavlovales sp. CCMP2436]|nr:hypothetical protein T492DRAFT_844271 [Pavlovales sp. CCMP2436]
MAAPAPSEGRVRELLRGKKLLLASQTFAELTAGGQTPSASLCNALVQSLSVYPRFVSQAHAAFTVARDLGLLLETAPAALLACALAAAGDVGRSSEVLEYVPSAAGFRLPGSQPGPASAPAAGPAGAGAYGSAAHALAAAALEDTPRPQPLVAARALAIAFASGSPPPQQLAESVLDALCAAAFARANPRALDEAFLLTQRMYAAVADAAVPGEVDIDLTEDGDDDDGDGGAAGPAAPPVAALDSVANDALEQLANCLLLLPASPPAHVYFIYQNKKNMKEKKKKMK